MAAAIAAGPLRPKARPHSMLDAHALNAAATALVRDPLHAIKREPAARIFGDAAGSSALTETGAQFTP